MSKKIAILQSNYIPWKGYFDLINSVDEFVLYDDVQYTKNDWRNRNILKTNHGLKWLTIPVQKNKLGQLIKDTKICDRRWARNHWASVSQAYSKARYFNEYQEVFEQLYLAATREYLSEVNFMFIKAINKLLGINTRLRWSSEFNLVQGQTERLIEICKQCNATEYISGPAAKRYLDIELARKENIKVTWVEYGGYKEYQQLYPPYEHKVSILDLILNEGPNASKYMRSFEGVNLTV